MPITGNRWSVPLNPRHPSRPESLGALVPQRAAEDPCAIAVQDGETTLTYAELERRSAAIAAGLRERGIGEGDLVAVCIPRSWRYLCAVVGVVRAGAAYAPLAAESPRRRLRTMLEVAGAAAVIADATTFDLLPSDPAPLAFQALLDGEGEAPTLATEDPLAYVLFTSGSTGVPKGVEVGEAQVLNLIGARAAVIPAPGDRVLMLAPVEFDLSVLEIWGGMAVGARIVVMPAGTPDPVELGRLIRRSGVTWALFPSGLLGQLVRVALDDLAGLRVLAAAGDVLSPAVAGAVRSAHPALRLVNGYGPTEATVLASSFEVGTPDGPIPIGRPLPGYVLHVLDQGGDPVPDGEAGELWIGGRGVARGYRGDPERTAARFRPDPFSDDPAARIYGTGDVVRRGVGGDLEILGRVDDQVKIAGHRVEPGEVGRALERHADVLQAVVVAREDISGHKRLIGFVALAEGAHSTADDLCAHLAEVLPRYMVPTSITILPELPTTERGKVDRAALPASPRPGGGSTTAEMGPFVATVAELMAAVLGFEALDADDDFFALGADSLLAIQLLGRLRERFDVGIDITVVFEAPTPRGMAARIEAGDRRPRPVLRRTSDPGPAPASFAQRRAWLFEQMHPDDISYQFAFAVHLDGEVDSAAVEAAVAALIERHEVLRTALVERDGEPVQVVADRVGTPFEIVDLRGENELAWARLVRDRVRRKIPFDRAPMLRAVLVRRGERRWSLLVVEHHAIHDGWSSMIMRSELAELYSARVEGRQPALAPLPVQFGDFARWERLLLDDQRRREQLDYWRRTLDSDPSLVDLAPGRPRPRRESFVGGSIRRRLSPDLAERLRELGRETGTSLFQVCFGAFALLLARLGDAEDIQIGSGLANRRDPASEPLIGMIVETVVLRVRMAGEPTVRQLLRRVHEALLGALAHSDVPFDLVVEELAPPRRAGRSPLIQTLFSFDDAAGRTVDWSGLDHRLLHVISNGSAKADLNVVGVDHVGETPYFVWEHSDLLGQAEAARLADLHVHLLERFCADPDAPIASLGLAGEAELARLREWESGDEDYDRDATIPAMVRRRAARDPDAIAVRGPAEEVPYGELLRRAMRIAGSLRTAGIAVGDRVGILLPRSPAAIAAHLGVLIAGAAYVPLDLGHPRGRSAVTLTMAGAKAVIVAEAVEGLAEDVRQLGIEEVLAGEPFEGVDVTAEDLAYLIFTSGSTGSPKPVEVTHRNVVRLLDAPAFADFGPGTTMLHAASTAFDAATLEIWGPLLNGGTIATVAEPPVPDVIAAAIGSGVDAVWLTAGLFHELVDRRPDALAGVSHLMAGGDVLSPDHVRRALAALPADARLTNGYGPTEATVFALTHTMRPGAELDGAVPLGRPVQGAVCEVIDAAGHPAPVGTVGELWIGGDGVARGYRGDSSLTAERFRPDPRRSAARRYRTGDLVYRDADGLIHFLGRVDRQLKIRGFRVEPGEVESVLRELPEVADVAVVAVAEGRESRLVAYVVGTVGEPTPDPVALRAHLVPRLPAAMIPAAWVPLPRLPLTPNGKLDRERLPAPTSEHLAAGGRDDTPRDDLERAVVAAFERVLKVAGVGPGSDFFALGGHSLLAVELFAELEGVVERRLPLAMIFEASTARALAERIGSDQPRSDWDNLVALKPSGDRPPLFVVSAGDGNLVGFAPLARHLSAAQPLYGLQPSGLDGRQPLDQGIGAMADRYLARVREVQPHGPYLLAGRCNGASVAYEMAQRLGAIGEEVPVLVSLDSDPPPAGPLMVHADIAFDPMIESACLRGEREGQRPPTPDDGLALRAWLREPVGPGISRYLLEAWHWRDDLRISWPDPCGDDAAGFAWWSWEHGIDEMDLVPALLLPAAADRCRVPGGGAWHWALEVAWSELGSEPADPLSDAGWVEFRRALQEAVDADGVINRYLLAAARRPDLAAYILDPAGVHRELLLDWAWTGGVREGLDPRLLPPSPKPLSRGRQAELRTLPLRRGARRVARRAHAGTNAAVAELRARALEGFERRLDRPLPGARRRIERRVIAAARRARASYRAEPWPGSVLLVVSAEFARKPPYAAWEARAQGGVKRRELPVGHVEMLREPGVEHLARCLEAYIEEALSR